MANNLSMSKQQAIIGLLEQGWSQRRIARETGFNRKTIRRYGRLRAAKCSISTAGSSDSKYPISTAGTPAVPGRVAGRQSQCEPVEPQIRAGLEKGLSAQRIFQDLVADYQFAGSYESVKRFVRRLDAAQPLPFRRMECAPAQEMQVDFGRGAWVMVEGKRKRPYVFRVVLSHSRKGYSEVVWQQSTENFIRCLENAVRAFGGVPQTIVIDNLRAAVTQADWFDPQLNPKIIAFAEHYRTVILPTKPFMPRHKGKVEAGVKYVQNNALKGRTFASLAEQNQFLAEWENGVADTRIHGTTRQQVGRIFATVEQPQLTALPATLFPVFSEALRHVHLDGHVEVARTYYSVPPEYVRRRVWARWDLRLVRIYNSRMEQIALHARQQPGRFNTDPQHIHSRKRAAIENGLDYLLDRARLIGPHSGQWAETMVKNRGPQGIRVLQGFLQLARKHAPANVEAASQLAATYGVWHLHELRSLLAAPVQQDQFQFVQQHPLIRDLDQYQALLPDCFASVTQTNHPPTESEHESSPTRSNPPPASPVGTLTNTARALAGSGGQPPGPCGVPGTHLPG
jgi:transposase